MKILLCAKVRCFSVLVGLFFSACAFAGGPAGVKYFGFDWMDAIDGVSVVVKKNNINAVTNTNMNIVYQVLPNHPFQPNQWSRGGKGFLRFVHRNNWWL